MKSLFRSQFLKRMLDISVALVLMLIFLPVWVILPLLIKLDSPGPIFYRHKRLGKLGREFWLIKFRSMVEDADDILHHQDKRLLKEFKKGDWKLRHDPRITPLGRLIRNLTLDEFPQLVNVLMGDMSIVGPRAYLKGELNDQVRKYPVTQKLMKHILRVKPGITGPWQTSGRNEIPFDIRAGMDATYARNWTVFRDISIMLKTPRAMISKW